MTHDHGGPGQSPGASGHPGRTAPGSAVDGVPGHDPADVDLLRADLQGWTVDAVHELLGPVAQDALAREQPVPALRAVSGRLDEPVAALTAAFVLGRPVPRRHLEPALAGLGVAGGVRLGLLSATGEGADDDVRALVD